MEANELMIGDWCFIKNYPIKALPQKVQSEHFVRSLIEFEPIPLTAEILEKNGFEAHDRYIWEQKVNHCFIKLNIAPKIEINGKTFNEQPILLQVNGAIFSLSMIVKYIHELQHALKLCGIDKTIKL